MKLEKFQMGPGSMWLFFAAISFGIVPRVLKAIIFYSTKQSLSEPIVLLCTIVGIVMGIIGIFIVIAIRVGKEHRKALIKNYIKGLLPIVFSYLCYMELIDVVYPWLIRIMPNYLVASIVVWISGAICIIWFSGNVLVGILRCLPNAPKHKIKHIICHPICSIVGMGLFVFSIASSNLIAAILRFLPGTIAMNLPKLFVVYVLIALVQTVCWDWIFKVVQSSIKQVEGDTEQTPFKVDTLVYLVGIIALLAIRGVMYYGTSPVTIICDEINYNITEGGFQLVAGDEEAALEAFQDADLLVQTWSSVAGITKASSLQELFSKYSSNDTIYYLYSIAHSRIDLLEQYLRVKSFEPEFGLALLDLYKKQNELTDVQKIYQKEILYLCIETDTYVSSYLRPEDIEGHTEKLEQKLSHYEMVSYEVDMLEQSIAIMREGRVTQEIVNTSLNFAKMYPDDWVAQYLAAVSGSNLLYDNAGHYGKTIEAAKRFETLYTEQNELSDTDLCGVQLKTAQMIVSCYGYLDAIEYLEKAVALGAVEESFAMLAQCYESLEMYEECYALANKLLKVNPELVDAHYYGAIAALKAGMIDELLVHVVALAEAVQQEKTDVDGDIALYGILQYMILKDSIQWTDYRYEVYTKLTEEQKAVINENTFLANYMEAIYQCFYGKEKEHLQIALEAVEEVLQENEWLPQAWYLKGCIFMGMDAFEEAVEAYRESVSIEANSATAWYSLAGAYDALGKYEDAYDACKRALHLLPEQDHGTDWYGVSIHCQNLINALEQKIEEGN